MGDAVVMLKVGGLRCLRMSALPGNITVGQGLCIPEAAIVVEARVWR